jgi:hypothetical protein
VAGVLTAAGFTVETVHAARIWTLPVNVVMARAAGAQHVD